MKVTITFLVAAAIAAATPAVAAPKHKAKAQTGKVLSKAQSKLPAARSPETPLAKCKRENPSSRNCAMFAN